MIDPCRALFKLVNVYRILTREQALAYCKVAGLPTRCVDEEAPYARESSTS